MAVSTNVLPLLHAYGTPAKTGEAHGFWTAQGSQTGEAGGGSLSINVKWRTKVADRNRIFLLRTLVVQAVSLADAAPFSVDVQLEGGDRHQIIMQQDMPAGDQALPWLSRPLMIYPDKDDADLIILTVPTNTDTEDWTMLATGEYWETQQTRLSGTGPRVQW